MRGHHRLMIECRLLCLQVTVAFIPEVILFTRHAVLLWMPGRQTVS